MTQETLSVLDGLGSYIIKHCRDMEPVSQKKLWGELNNTITNLDDNRVFEGNINLPGEKSGRLIAITFYVCLVKYGVGLKYRVEVDSTMKAGLIEDKIDRDHSTALSDFVVAVTGGTVFHNL